MEATTTQGEMAPAELISHTRRVIEGCRWINESFGYKDDEPTLFEAVTDLAATLLARAEKAERELAEAKALRDEFLAGRDAACIEVAKARMELAALARGGVRG